MDKSLRNQINYILKLEHSATNTINQISNKIYRFKTGLLPYENKELYNKYEDLVSKFYFNSYLTNSKINKKDFFICLEMEFKI